MVVFHTRPEWLKWFIDNVKERKGDALSRAFTPERCLDQLRRLTERDVGLILREVERQMTKRVMEAFSAPIRAYFSMLAHVDSPTQLDTAVKEAVECVYKWLDIYEQADDDGFLIPTLVRLAATARKVALKADQYYKLETQDETGEEGRYMAEVVDRLRRGLSKVPLDRKRAGHIVITTQLVKSMTLADNMTAAAQQLKRDVPELDSRVPKGPSVEYAYYVGKIYLWMGRTKEAEERLTYAWRRCRSTHIKNNGIILKCLLLVRANLGRLPKPGILQQHGQPTLERVAEAVRKGNVREYNEGLNALERESLRDGTFLMLEHLRPLVHKTLCRRVYAYHRRRLVERQQMSGGPPPTAKEMNQMDIAMFHAAFGWQTDDPDFDADEMIGILANLIYLGHVKGYISYEHQKIVLAPQDPFP
uniref:PCI domain-containing protein n=1 Tax=Vitrella brassicaformis TaxID=1169539 RepID=A0A7S1JSB8_9ALVE|mmetsp:Transcript_21960/g.53881  ORF Transcript_21960/g.53881 Transcript_21960/m.53881 type:complete len:418 (+) Transcript_21960:135-1388(+)